ncbi:MAG: TolC family protein [Candidatus Hinthialibacter sp.]
MHRLSYFASIISLIILTAGCATKNPKAFHEYQQTQFSSFAKKTMDWAQSAAETVNSVSPSIESAAASTTIEAVTNQQDKFVQIAATVLNHSPEDLKQRMKLLSPREQMNQVLSRQLSWSDLRLAVALYNPAVIAAGERWKAALFQYDQASFLEGLINEFRAFTRYLNVETGKSMNKQIVQSFFPYPGAISLKGELVREQVRIAELDWQKILREKIVDAGMHFYDYQYFVLAENTIQENISLVENFLKVVVNQVSAGMGTQADIIKVQTELERQKNMLEDFQSKQQALIAQINALINRDPNEKPGALQHFNDSSVSISTEELMDLAMKNRQEILTQKSKVARTSIAIRMGEVMNRPSASQGYSQLERGMKPDASVAESSMSFGLMTKTNVRPSYAQAESYLMEMRQRLEAERSTLEQVIQDTQALARSSLEDMNIAKREVSLIDDIVLPQNRSAYNATLGYYQSGDSSFLDLLDAERELIRARLDSHNAHRSLNQSILRLTAVVGRISHY